VANPNGGVLLGWDEKQNVTLTEIYTSRNALLMEQEVNKMWIGMFGLILVLVTTSSNLLAQTLELKDLSSDCPRAYIVETERNSCAIVHLYTTRGFGELQGHPATVVRPNAS